MSGRSTSRKWRQKKRAAAVSPYAEGKAAFNANLPLGANPYHGPGRGKAHSWAKGWVAGMRELRI